MISLILSGEHPFNGRTTTFEFVKVRSAAEESQGGAEAIHNKHRSLNHLCEMLAGVLSLLLHVLDLLLAHDLIFPNPST